MFVDVEFTIAPTVEDTDRIMGEVQSVRAEDSEQQQHHTHQWMIIIIIIIIIIGNCAVLQRGCCMC
jgi:hypothetical protein